ncbi:MAG TPA: NUDIX hydrolase [Stellaceae bacterium]|nr:NUDIX hydrolase [Stellaceae bacterium]
MTRGDRLYPDRPIVGCLGVVRRGDRVLLAQRSVPPGIGRWGFPGGMQELGETVHACARRELEEETGIAADPVATLTVIDRIGHDEAGKVKTHFTLIAVLLDWRSGEGEPIEDATALAWLTPSEVRARRLELFPHALELMEMALARRG